MPPLPIEGVLKHYAWGSDRDIADLLGRSPSGRPEAELWFGAHEGGPSPLVGVIDEEAAKNLLELCREDPEEVLGESHTRRAGNRFPFLLKVLAAAEPLSLQAHPDLEQARLGYREERARGVSPESESANYKDANHKPELILALRSFAVLSGFCPWEESQRRLSLLGLLGPKSPIAEPLRAFSEVRNRASESEARAAFFRALFLLGESDRNAMTERIRRALKAPEAREMGALILYLERLVEKYPSDPGLVVVLLMNYLELEPGQALFMPARRLHAYLGGLGLEVMASSDNVLRGGLTPKRVDVAELCRVLNFGADSPDVLNGTELGGGESSVRGYPAPVSEFELSMVALREGGEHALLGPAILLVLEGTLHAAAETGHAVDWVRGQAAFVPASEGPVALTGCARLAVVRLPGVLDE